ncbi:MAG: saccharopine dehydrogenase NADP-binding domain-containing protein, partial [Rhodospirillales bacterium]
MNENTKHVRFGGRLVMVGFGSIGQGVLPLILRHIDMPKDRIVIVTAEPRGREVAAEYGIEFVEVALTRENYRAELEPRLGKGDFLLNLSVDVQSVALIELAQARGAHYLDTCIEPWAGGYT